jgi:hypothetical protein
MPAQSAPPVAMATVDAGVFERQLRTERAEGVNAPSYEGRGCKCHYEQHLALANTGLSVSLVPHARYRRLER